MRVSRVTWVYSLIGICAALVAVGVYSLRPGSVWDGNEVPSKPRGNPVAPHEQPVDSPPPPMPRSRFLNTSPVAEYVGIETCAECHPDEDQSYRLTGHSQALTKIDPEDEPAGGTFQHEPSGRFYRVYRDGNDFRHSETLRSAEGEPVIAADYPIRYRIGSGRHTRSYLVEADGFLIESPVTWYASRREWGMSPGYDRPNHPGFERAAEFGCLVCHTGRVEPVRQTSQRVTIHEQAIGCERCHGPGSLHADRHQFGVPGSQPGASERDDGDLTIVHPGRLARERVEAICAECHLRGEATVVLRGRRLTDFRPGLPLSAVRIDYRLEGPQAPMKVVGHVEQMHLSACYRQSETLTCTTCHDPHRDLRPQEKAGDYKRICLSCHSPEHCGLPQTERVKKNAEDNCLACHMPQVPTDIPHIAFTHHRIGIHASSLDTPLPGELASGGREPPGEIGRLVPHQDIARLPEIERKRCLGLAYLELSGKQADPRAFRTYRQRALRLLEDVRRKGLRDPAVDAALARLYWEGDHPEALQLAEKTLEAKHLSSTSHVNALFILGDSYLWAGNSGQALPFLEQLTDLRRHSEDWLLLGLCRQRLGQSEPALNALRRAVQINPFRPEIHQILAEFHERSGQRRQAEQHRLRVRLLSATAPSRER